jgi:hypothetical protein
VTRASVSALLFGIVDYAGLFPPASLGMETALGEYAEKRRSRDSWMLGRFVVPAARLDEWARVAAPHLPGAAADQPWRLSVLLGPRPGADDLLLLSFGAAHAGRAVVDSVEIKAASVAEAQALLAALPPGPTAFVELPLDADLEPLLAVLRGAGARAKLRTGGVVPEAIPDPADVARFLSACAAAGVPFKATAGLHHPLRAERPLTYAPDSPRAVMHGFLNVYAAAALARAGAGRAEIESVLREEDSSAFRFDDDGLAWRQRRLETAFLDETRREFAGSFGSCSFAEPVADLRDLGLVA